MNLQGPFEVRFADPANDDFHRLLDFLLDRAQTGEDLDAAQLAIDEIRAICLGSLGRTPFSYRKVDNSALRRELIISIGATGYVVQFEIEPALKRVIVLAVRHQREDDYH